MKKYYALYVESNDVLIFDSEEERDEFVWHEWEVHPDCIGVQYSRIEKLIKGKEPRFNSDFGCMAILADNGGNNKKFALTANCNMEYTNSNNLIMNADS